MGAVRNSNTRASHASVETPGGIAGTGQTQSFSAGAGSDSKGAAGTSGSAGPSDSHLAMDGIDRRPSFSYLRRASERRRRQMQMEKMEDEAGSPRAKREFFSSGRHRTSGASQRGSESGLESDAMRKDSIFGDPKQEANEQQQQHRIQHPDVNYDEDQPAGGQFEGGRYGPQGDYQHQGYGPKGDAPPRHQQHQHQRADDQRRQSNSDRLTDAVSDVIDFVRDESFKRGKRHSMMRRRGAGGLHSGTSHGGGGVGSHTGLTEEGEFDSEGFPAQGERSPGYRRRRIMRRSPRRQVQARFYNDSDTGSAASLSHEHALGGCGGGGDDHGQRYKLQQHGGSAQDAHLMFRGGPMNPAAQMDAMRRHQSADGPSQMAGGHYHIPGQQQMVGGFYPRNTMTLDGSSGLVAEYMDLEEKEPSGSGGIRPIPVGASPPPLVGSVDAELVAARRKRDEDVGPLEEEETAIHVSGSGPEMDMVSGGGGRHHSPGRFIAPKVSPLQSPSALLIPDEEIIPPDVPYRGRRLPQVPGSSIIKSAADFIHSSFYGGGGGGKPSTRSIGSAVAASAAPLVATSSGQESIFPSVSESPTLEMQGQVLHGPHAQATSGIVKRQASIAAQSHASAVPLETAGSLDGSGGINFPRVSFSPTHTTTVLGAAQQLPPVSIPGASISLGAGSGGGIPKQYHPTAMIATHAPGVGGNIITQSAVLAPQETSRQDHRQMSGSAGSGLGGGGGGGSIVGSSGWPPRGRRGKKDELEDNWF